MTLRLTLRPGESVYIGRTRVTVEAEATCSIIVQGKLPIMRANDMLDAANANESVARFRYVLQEMYLSDDLGAMIVDYVDAVSQLLAEHPDFDESIREANEMVRIGNLYQALKIGKKLAKLKPDT